MQSTQILLEDPAAQRRVKQIALAHAQRARTLVFVGHRVTLPPELQPLAEHALTLDLESQAVEAARHPPEHPGEHLPENVEARGYGQPGERDDTQTDARSNNGEAVDRLEVRVAWQPPH